MICFLFPDSKIHGANMGPIWFYKSHKWKSWVNCFMSIQKAGIHAKPYFILFITCYFLIQLHKSNENINHSFHCYNQGLPILVWYCGVM